MSSFFTVARKPRRRRCVAVTAAVHRMGDAGGAGLLAEGQSDELLGLEGSSQRCVGDGLYGRSSEASGGSFPRQEAPRRSLQRSRCATSSAPWPASAGPLLARGPLRPSMGGRCSGTVKRLVRSTSIPIAEFCSPRIRSPSQCPGTARSSAGPAPGRGDDPWPGDAVPDVRRPARRRGRAQPRRSPVPPPPSPAAGGRG